MATTSPARIDDELYASAKLAGDVQSRSASQQVAHWARIGRELEASAAISPKEIAAVLAGSRSYERLSPKEQAVVRAEWSIRIEELRGALNLADHFAQTGRSWVELAADGSVVERSATSGRGRTTSRNRAAKPAAVAKPRRNTTTKATAKKAAGAPKRRRTSAA